MTDLDMRCSCLSNNRMKFRGADALCVCRDHKKWCCKNHYTGHPYSASGDDYSNHILKTALGIDNKHRIVFY